MKKLLVFGIVMLLSLTIYADWDPEDGHKMHFPQLPDEFGYDVNFADTPGDDWQCTEDGWICDIHFWISWQEDMIGPLSTITAYIFDDIPAGPYSKPGNILWVQTFNLAIEPNIPGTFYVREDPYAGDQGWYDPGYPGPDAIIENDHVMFFQVNLTCDYIIEECFWQTAGTIYWLVLEINDPGVGWKTSLDHFNDDAVFWAPSLGDWYPLTHFALHPPYNDNVDLAFVVNGQDTPCPVELSTFYGTYIENPTLYWTTETETDNSHWNIYRAVVNDFANSQAIHELAGQGTVTHPTDYNFIDTSPTVAGETYWYWIESVSISGESEIFDPIYLTIPSGDAPLTPESYGVAQNYPNPFNPSTSIDFTLPEEGIAKLAIYDLKGELVTVLFNDFVEANTVNSEVWNGEDKDGKKVASGVYFYKLITSEQTYTKKMLLIK